jgi:hypothetical protein
MTFKDFIKRRFHNIEGFDEEELHLIRNKLLRIITTSTKDAICIDEISLSTYYDSSSSFLNDIFIWCDTPEGHDYWYDIFLKLLVAEKEELDYHQLKIYDPNRKLSDGESRADIARDTLIN